MTKVDSDVKIPSLISFLLYTAFIMRKVITIFVLCFYITFRIIIVMYWADL